MSATTKYTGSPKDRPRSIYSKHGNVVVEDGDIYLNTSGKHFNMSGGSYVVGGCGYVPSRVLSTGNKDALLTPENTVVLVNNANNINVYLPNPTLIKPGHTVYMIPYSSSYAHGIIANYNYAPCRMAYKGSLYDKIIVSAVSGGRTAAIMCVYMGVIGSYHTWVAGTLDQSGISYGSN